PPEYLRGVVAVWKAVEHSGSALRAPVAGIGAGSGEWNRAQTFQLPGGGFHQQPHFPVARMIAERHRRTIRVTDSAVCAEDEDLLAAHGRRIPTHAGVLAPPEQIARWTRQQHLRSD